MATWTTIKRVGCLSGSSIERMERSSSSCSKTTILPTTEINNNIQDMIDHGTKRYDVEQVVNAPSHSIENNTLGVVEMFGNEDGFQNSIYAQCQTLQRPSRTSLSV